MKALLQGPLLRYLRPSPGMLNPWLSMLTVIVPVSLMAQVSYSPYAETSYPANVYWGDTHLHTTLSVDASYIMGNRLGPEEAYRFAKGETVTESNGLKVSLRRPLDFLVIADHAENLGVVAGLVDSDPELLDTEVTQRLLQQFSEADTVSRTHPGQADRLSLKLVLDIIREDVTGNEAFRRSVWERVTSNADRHNAPGRFTAFIGYEWSSPGRESGNLHRNLIFKDGAEKANEVLPFSVLDSKDPEALWAWMAEYESQTGGEVLAIPHNGNVSNGEMFPLQSFAGEALTRSYAERRRRWEPLYEVTQIKGDSESHPFLSPTDEFADYETWSSWYAKNLPAGRTWNQEEKARKQGEYARSALKRGLGLQAKLGVNPFQFGLIGSTDAHTSLPAVEENNFLGAYPITHPRAARLGEDLGLYAKLDVVRSMGRLNDGDSSRVRMGLARGMAAAGYAAVWAEENTRAALFAAMKRRETYATTGPRMTVRFFGGWDYVLEDAVRPDLALIGYKKGVPMGGDLTHAPEGKSPTFLIRAVKDPEGAHLDRVQVIKGWRDANGDLHEKIYNVALSDARKEDENGKAPLVGSTVEIKNATYTNTIGDPELAVVWTDPDFDADELSFYYVRVLEIPTPRWTAYDAKFFGIQPIPHEVPMIMQERAYTSPIWYTPSSGAVEQIGVSHE